MQRMFGWAVGLIAMLGAAGLPAHAQQRSLQVPAASGWKHAETGLILRPRLAGFARNGLTDNGNAELDVAAQFEDASTRITVFLFRPALQSVPVWFDRAETQILLRGDTFGKAQPIGPVQAFAAPGATAASALRRVYTPARGPYRSTGLAVIPLGRWLVAIRISSQQFDTAELDARLSEAVAGIGWPQGVAESPAAAPVLACAKPLDYAKRAKMKKPSINDALMGAIMPAVAASAAKEGKAEPGPSLFCRDLPPRLEYGTYRAPDATNAYVMAIGDAGRIVSVSPSLAGLVDNSTSWGVSFGGLDSTDIFPPFDKLPHPDQAWKALTTSNPISSSSGNGANITIGMPGK
ncbi:MAG: hypothetical protein V4574_10815 [Pseudomonadota bacterium]